MFTVKEKGFGGYYIGDGYSNYMHRDGEIVHTCCEYWPTKELAQVVLDKYQPPYIWKHGDIAVSHDGFQRVFINVDGKLRIYDEIGQIFTRLTSIQQWAEHFGYKKTGNVFGFGL